MPHYIEVSPSGKARDFDSLIRGFKSCHLCQKNKYCDKRTINKIVMSVLLHRKGLNIMGRPCRCLTWRIGRVSACSYLQESLSTVGKPSPKRSIGVRIPALLPNTPDIRSM